MDRQRGYIASLKENPAAEWNLALPGDFNFGAQRMVARIELPQLVKLAIVWRIGLRHDAEDAEEAVADAAGVPVSSVCEIQGDREFQGRRELDLRGAVVAF